jgi:dCMP deaminase
VHAEQNAIINAARAGVSLLGGDMYIYGSDAAGEKPIDAFPCYICKKMLINAGLTRVVCSTSDGGSKIFLVEDWIRDWRERDILDDEHQYGKKG